jgi:hypothetical protein
MSIKIGPKFEIKNKKQNKKNQIYLKFEYNINININTIETYD